MNYKNIKIMETKDLKKDLADIKAKIKSNSVDAHYADTLIAELLSIKGQLDHEPTLVHIPLSTINDKLEGETFGMYDIATGDVVYRLKGGFTIVASDRFASFNETIKGYIANQHVVDYELTQEDKELYDMDLQATCMLLNLPTYTFSDLDFKYKIVNHIIEYLDELQNQLLLDAELQDETPKENREFEEVTLATDALKEVLDLNEQKD